MRVQPSTQRALSAVNSVPSGIELVRNAHASYLLMLALGAAGDTYHAEREFAGFEGNVLAMDAYRFS